MERLGTVPNGAAVKGMSSSAGATIGDRQGDRRNMTLVQKIPQSRIRQVGSDLRPVFAGFPKTTLLESGQIPIAEIAALILLISANAETINMQALPLGTSTRRERLLHRVERIKG
jgi:hypothetical protein